MNDALKISIKENKIEYVGLSRGGKIMKITPFLYNNLYVRIENILAFNDGIEILKDKDIDLKMNKLIQRNNLQIGFKDLLEMYLKKQLLIMHLIQKIKKVKRF